MLLNHARYSALQYNERYTICPLNQSGQCALPWQGAISVFKDTNGNRRLDANEQIIQIMQLDTAVSLHWQGTGPDHSLHFAGNGITHLSNGTFILCHPQSASQRRIIINRQGRVRTSKSPTPCPTKPPSRKMKPAVLMALFQSPATTRMQPLEKVSI